MVSSHRLAGRYLLPDKVKRRKEDTMSPIIKRFKEDLQLAGYAKRSTESYVSSVLRLQRFYNKPLEDITEEDLRQYWLCCHTEFGWSAASLRISYSGIQHFFTRTLVRSWNIFSEIKWKREQKLPTILSLQEVRTIIYALPTLQSHTFYRDHTSGKGYSRREGSGSYSCRERRPRPDGPLTHDHPPDVTKVLQNPS